MATKADLMRANALHEVGSPYVWGTQGDGSVAGYDTYDCSGFVWAMYNGVGVHMVRTTAEGLWHKGTHIAAPSLVGDTFYLLSPNGHAHHVGLYVGKSQIVEARSPQRDVCLGTVAGANKRGARWNRRFADLGSLTPVTTPVGTRYMVVPDETAMHKYAGASSSVVMPLVRGNVVTQTGPLESNGWLPCKRLDPRTNTVKTGYVYFRYLVVEKQ